MALVFNDVESSRFQCCKFHLCSFQKRRSKTLVFAGDLFCFVLISAALAALATLATLVCFTTLATLVALALYGAFITRSESVKNEHYFNLEDIAIKNPWIFCTLLIGSMLPYLFSAMTMKSVGNAA